MPDYDIPRRMPPHFHANTPLSGQQLHLQSIHRPNTATGPNAFSTYDVPAPAVPIVKIAAPKELPLELTSALETLAKLQNEAAAAVTK